MRYEYETLKVDQDGMILNITMNRPERLNAVNPVMHEELSRIWEDVGKDESVRVAVITGAGRAFCAGGDVGRMAEGAEEDLVGRWVKSHRESKRIVQRVLECDKPVIAKINGPAVGLGATIALACDVIFMAEEAKIGDTHVKVGLVAGDGGSALWPWLVGFHRAKEFLLSGDLISGTEAERIGLVNHAVPLAKLDEKVHEFADRLCNNPPRALQWTKIATNSHLRALVATNMDASLPLEAMSKVTSDHVEAARAFKEKRKPVLRGR